MQTSPAITPRTLFEHDHDIFRDSYRRFVQKETRAAHASAGASRVTSTAMRSSRAASTDSC